MVLKNVYENTIIRIIPNELYNKLYFDEDQTSRHYSATYLEDTCHANQHVQMVGLFYNVYCVTDHLCETTDIKGYPTISVTNDVILQIHNFSTIIASNEWSLNVFE
ncbi:hypothetical protein AB6A40_004046 [Gnathostoma spinigerum]|uniref:Uncharacterized protein n=1 Tax=Gnathostoma spinigerum TaxID=75299 RepID=A0ABD6EDI5_9BILA